MSRPLRITAIVLGVLVLLVATYAAAGFWLVPWILESQVRQVVADELSLEASFERVAFDPFAMRLEVDGFAMGRSGEAPLAALEALRLDVEAVRLPATRIVASELYLGGPSVTLEVSPEGGIQIAGLPVGGGDAASSGDAGEGDGEDAGDAGPEEEAPSGGPAPIAQLRIRSLRLDDGHFVVRDRSRNPPLERDLTPISLEAENLDLTDLLRDLDDVEPSTAELVFGLGGGARLTASGDVDVDPLSLDLDLVLEGLPLDALQPYVASFSTLTVRSGVLDADGHLAVGSDTEGDFVDFSGQAGVLGLRLDLPDEEGPALAWEKLAVSGIEVRAAPLSVRVAGIDLTGPGVRVVNGAQGIDLARAFATGQEDGPSSPAADTGDAEASAPPDIEVGKIALSNGRVRFEDRTVEPRYAVDVAELALTVDGFRSAPDSRSQLELSGQIDGYAPVRLAGGLSPMAPTEYLDLTLGIDGVELRSFTPYAGRYVGREIDGGRGSVDVAMKIDARVVDADNEVRLQGLDFGKAVASPQATSLPVATAATLAKDKDGAIGIDIPIHGSLDDPGFSYTGTLVDTLRRLITRVVATPYQLVGGMISFGGELFRPEDLDTVAFEAGSAELSSASATKVDAVAQGLRSNDALALAIQGTAAQSVDGNENLGALARRRARAVRERLEAAGIASERISERDIEIDESVVGEGGDVLTRLEIR